MSKERFSDFDEDSPRKFSPGPSFVFGLLIIAVGAILLLERFGLIDSDLIFRFWPLALVAFGVARLLSQNGRVFGAVLIVAGLAIFTNKSGLIHMDWATLWPIILICFGGSMLYRALRKRGKPQETEASKTQRLSEWAVFGGGRLLNNSKDFRGGEVFAMFGGYEVDLTGAEIRDDEVEIQANVVFGGVEIRVPPNWDVRNKGVPIFGGYEDKRVPRPGEPAEVRKRLTVSGFAVFGGVEINSAGA
jgi:predicted membrane protein